MKKILLDGNANRYKANLHCHTNISDGTLSPGDVKEAYKQKGYSVVAYTDHDVLIGHNDLTDDTFLALNGYEIEINEPWSKDMAHKACHICFIQRDPDNLKQVCWHREKYLFGNAQKYKDQVQFDENEPDFEREYTPECINNAIKIARDNGFFVTYNHPTWSNQNYADYMRIHNMHAMEICNYACFIDGFDELNHRVYDDMLRGGERIYCIGADDNHNFHPFDSLASDSFGAYIVIFADELSYKSVTDSLFEGRFYASQGPEIYSLWYDGALHITCSPAERVYMSTNRRAVQCAYASKDKPVTEATFKVSPDDKYVRVTVMDKYGKRANTNAYFIDDLTK